MGDKTGIEWTGRTWNPLVGCAKVSAGCKHCYAERMAVRLAAMGNKHYAQVVENKRWNGKVVMIPEKLTEPLRWTKPSVVFVNSMSDLFHEDVPQWFIHEVLHVVEQCPRHTFQILTKRPERAAAIEWTCTKYGSDFRYLPNLWLGTSVENQEQADIRIPHLLRCPAAVRFLSCEPLLGALNISEYLRWSKQVHIGMCVAGALRNKVFSGFTENGRPMSRAAVAAHLQRLHADGVKMIPMMACDTFDPEHGCPGHDNPRIDWVIVGGESGPGARPMHPDWARGVRDQCVAAGVKFFFKQGSQANWHSFKNYSSFPVDLQIREFPNA